MGYLLSKTPGEDTESIAAVFVSLYLIALSLSRVIVEALRWCVCRPRPLPILDTCARERSRRHSTLPITSLQPRCR